MAVVILALGSRGDVQPMANLAGGLARRGVEVSVAALPEYAPVVADHGDGARFVPLPGRLADAVGEGRLDRRLTQSSPGQWLVLRRWLAAMAPGFVDAVTAAIRPGDTVLSGVLTRGVAVAFAEAGGRAATVTYTGQVPTLERESFYHPGQLTGWRAWDTFGVGVNWQLATAIGGVLTRRTRECLGLPQPGFRGGTRVADRHPVIMAASPVLVPPAADWADGVHQTGYLAPRSSPFTPDPALAAFLAGPRAVYLGFGSLTRFASREEFGMVVEAARLSGRRLVTSAPPWVTAGEFAPDVFAVDGVPHGWLFSRLAGTIHHGGAGTTHEALRSGVPSVVVPFGLDQPYHGARLHRLGVGPAPLGRKRLTAQRLADLISELVDSPRTPRYQSRAVELAAICSAEDGVGRTVDLLAELGMLPPDGGVRP